VTRKKRQGIASLPKIVAIVTFTLVAALTVDFGRKALDNYDNQRQVDWLKEQVAIERETHDELQAGLDYAGSDAYVEKIARERLKLVQPGETAMVVIPGEVDRQATAGETSPAESAEEGSAPYWRQWADLLLGSGE
jgi:cell division protein FtsB